MSDRRSTWASATSFLPSTYRWGARVACIIILVLFISDWIVLTFPKTPLAGSLSQLIPAAGAHRYKATSALERRDFVTASNETRKELLSTPLSQDAWMRLASIDAQTHSPLSPAGDAALRHAYSARPYSADPASPRLIFALDHYAELSDAAKADVSDELDGWASLPRVRARLRRLALSTNEPDGRAAIAAALAKFS